jgi:hypothetical protein
MPNVHVNDEVERKSEQPVVACFKLLYHRFSQGTEDNHEMLYVKAAYRVQVRTGDLSMRSRSAKYWTATFGQKLTNFRNLTRMVIAVIGLELNAQGAGLRA